MSGFEITVFSRWDLDGMGLSGKWINCRILRGLRDFYSNRNNEFNSNGFFSSEIQI
jgi:hypothetical protein